MSGDAVQTGILSRLVCPAFRPYSVLCSVQGSRHTALKDETHEETSAVFPETPDNSDLELEHEADRRNEVVTQVKKNSFLVCEALKPGTKTQAGALHILSRSKKVFQCKWCILGHGNLRWFNEDISMANPKETILLNNIFSVTKKTEKQVSANQEDLFCFDISALNSKGKFCVYLIGALTSHER